jgi:hypothetical protein
LAGMFVLLLLLLLIPSLSVVQRLIITVVWAIFLSGGHDRCDFEAAKDERERIHEAIAERNWGMIMILAMGIFVELLYNALHQRIYVDPFIL